MGCGSSKQATDYPPPMSQRQKQSHRVVRKNRHSAYGGPQGAYVGNQPGYGVYDDGSAGGAHHGHHGHHGYGGGGFLGSGGGDGGGFSGGGGDGGGGGGGGGGC